MALEEEFETEIPDDEAEKHYICSTSDRTTLRKLKASIKKAQGWFFYNLGSGAGQCFYILPT